MFGDRSKVLLLCNLFSDLPMETVETLSEKGSKLHERRKPLPRL